MPLRPPKIPSQNYFVSPNDKAFLKTPEQYAALYKSGALANMRINEAFINGGGSNMSQSANITRPTTETQTVGSLSQSANISKPTPPTYSTQDSIGLNDNTPVGLVTKSLNELEFGDKEKGKPWGVASQPTLSTSIADFYDNMNGKKEEKQEKKDDDIPFDLLPWEKKLELWRGFSAQADYVEEMGESTDAPLERRRLPEFSANVKFDDLLKNPEFAAELADVADV